MIRRVSLLLVLALVACSGPPSSAEASSGASASGEAEGTAGQGHARRQGHADAGARAHEGHVAMAAGEVTSGSVYNLQGTWWDAAADTAPLVRLAGRPQVVSMVYTSCAQACPAILAEMKRIEAALGDDAAHVGFVLASMDPERDTPEKLAEFARRAQLDPGRWTLLGAPDGDVLELAAVLGVQYRRLPDGEFAHSNIVTVLDANGEVVHRQLGLGAETAATVDAARRAARTS